MKAPPAKGVAKAAAKAVVTAAGLALIAVGVRGVVADLDAAAWLTWFAGAAVLHDGVLVPVVLAAGLATRRLPDGSRPVVRAALVTAACVTAVALPLVLGHGRRADEPSRLPLPYDRNLAAVLAVIAAAAAAAIAARALTGRRRDRRRPGQEDPAHEGAGPSRATREGRT
ncbi:hypothetical protein E1281_30870 [Actinomadura sp. KC345]|uniref:hypothetical protein n=1 Tax=Actinomadura sp. KC345 TaxID=2530371 RepID=UPI0010516452|nr:hypothetical protein [Actinomadura sp. KC345]TDC45272.1 hypothetical protein E1281_30870 [Actinomadura sp. KC345]